jgi:hypothetical protein
MKTKRCPTCETVKPLSEFHKNRTKKDGHAAICRICKKPHDKNWLDNNRERARANSSAWKQDNPERQAAYNSTWRKHNRGKCNAYNAKREAKQRQSFVEWADDAAMETYYALSRLLTLLWDTLYSVDHYVSVEPEKDAVTGELKVGSASGLHCAHNLRVIPQVENSRKKNHHDPDIYIHDMPWAY